MNRIVSAVAVVLAAAVVAVVPLHAAIIVVTSLLDLEQTADLVIVGSAQGAVTVGTAASFSLRVTRVVKGDATLTGSVIPVYWTSGEPRTGGARNGSTSPASGSGLWFLKQGSGPWLLLPVIQGQVQVGMTYFPTGASPVLSAYVYSAAAPTVDKVASELCSAIEASPDGFGFVLPGPMYAGLDELQSPVVALFYQRMAGSASVRQRIVGLGGLIRQGNEPALEAAVRGIPSFGAYILETGILEQSIRNQFRAMDLKSITTLGQAATDSTNSVLAFREAVAHALSSIHTLSTLLYLAALLDDADSNLRVEAIGGIASFANGLPSQIAAPPNVDSLQLSPAAPYRTPETIAKFALGSQTIELNEAAYLSFWKQWWTEHRTRLGF